MTPASAAVTRATCAAVFAAITMSLCAARIHAQCVPAPPFTDARVYYHLDQVGSVHLLTDASGQVGQETRHYPYGPFIGNQPVASASPFGFAGHRNVESHGLAYFEARYYVPELAIFASRDPAAQFQNPYTYADGDPLSLRDPDGKWFVQAIAGLLFVGELVLDGVLSPPPDNQGTGIPTAEQEALQPAPNPLEAVAAGGAVGRGVTRVAGGVVGRGAAVADDVVEAVANNAPVRWGPATGVGPLGKEVAETFRSGSYTERVTSEVTTLYRSHGGAAEAIGPYWTRTPPAGPLQSRIDSALRTEWGNTATGVSSIRIPAGTTIFEGFAASQGGLVGGGSQVFIPKVDPSWLVR